ncbi:hypothetical protein A2870_02095 [Candidatus Curtissbacteria bacterium RIFCSPHIGHO2_01_FULL_41_11]|uniref:Cytochrome b561 domain-containing protein n=1 Tax=Candidatus Curtissbacteria bacterium RIFCSPHIGHO2_01_FULL_41_11 TaxID=1797711 RepID=A0A1F5G426_9BACT|nr:MAG: hypothetical protein A2870_02095 [Candidatus Curtissbacteria bacterium RIFCSPHIGHO2_01_FULL_41_11]
MRYTQEGREAKNMKMLIIIILVILGLYWLIDHTAPLPLNHEQFGLYQHGVHRIVGVVFLVAAGLVWWMWKAKKTE